MRMTYHYMPSPPEPPAWYPRRMSGHAGGPASRQHSDEQARVNRWEAEGGALAAEGAR